MEYILSEDITGGNAARSDNVITVSVTANDAVGDESNPLTVVTANGDVLLAHTMPQAEYMYGCTPTATGMLLGYYDLYGYRGKSYENLIAGKVALISRGTDGNAYDMDAFDTVLGRAIASEDYVSRFVSVSPEEELKYSFTNGGEGPDLRTDNWNCIADYLGTGQCWRGNGDLSTSLTMMSLEDLLNWNQSQTFVWEEIHRTVDWRYTTMLYGLYLYVTDKGYALDAESTGTYTVDVNKGSFTFEDYMAEIDAGRPVLISITAHSMVGYGYNAETREIIFDDCYEADRRMVWDGSYHYSGANRRLESITVIRFMNSDDIDLVMNPVEDSSGGTVLTLADGSFADDFCYVSDSLSVAFTVSNTGSAPCDPFAVSVYVDGQLTETFSNVYLEAGSTREFRDVPLGPLGVGLHKVRIVADEKNIVSELSGQNNSLEQKVMVLKDGTNIISDFVPVVSGEVSVDDYVMSGWQLHVLDGGLASGTLIQGKITDVSPEGAITYLPGVVVVSKGGLVRDAAVYEYGQLLVKGAAENVRVYEHGKAVISAGASASGLRAYSSSTVRIEAGGILTGEVRVANGASVYFENGGILHFDLSGSEPGSDAPVHNFSYLLGDYSCTLTVDASLSRGQYKLADDVDSFSGTITVSDTSGVELGVLAVKNPVVTESVLYSLKLSKGTLLLNIKAIHPEKPVVSADVTEPTNGDVLVSAIFDDESFLKEYSFDGSMWFKYTEPVKMSQNGTVYFRAANEEGFVSEIASCTVENIDKNLVSGLILNKGESATVYSGQTYSETILSGGTLYVREEGLAHGARVGSGGLLFLSSGGTAVHPVVENGGCFEIRSGGTAADVAWTPCVGSVRIEHGAEVTFADELSGVYYGSGGQLLSHTPVLDSQTVSRASMYAMSGGTAKNADIGFSGFLYAFGGTVSGAVIHSCGYCCASWGGVLSDTTVSSGGKLIVSSGGTAVKIVENGGYVAVQDGGHADFASHVFSGLNVYSSATVHSGTTANSTTVNDGCLFLYSGGKLTGRTVCQDGVVSTFEGAVLDFDLTQTAPDGAARINDFSRIQGTTPIYTITVSSTQEEGIYRLADGVSEFTGTISVMDSAGTELASFSVGETKSVAGVDCSLQLSGNTLSLKYGTDPGSIPATSNGLVLSKETRTVGAGELFRDTVINSGGTLHIAEGGRANDTAVNSGGVIRISGGGQVKTLDVNSGGVAYVSAGGSALLIRENGGMVEIKDGAEENVTFLPNTFSNHLQTVKSVSLHSGTTAVDLTIMYKAAICIFSGGLADGTTVSSGGVVFVSSGGSAGDTAVSSGGIVSVSSGGICSGVQLASDGRLNVKESGTLTGRIAFDAGAVASFYEGAVLDFDLTQTEPGGAALVNNLSIIQGTPLYTLTVDGDWSPGTHEYRLADGASDFNGPISVVNRSGDKLGTLTVGKTAELGIGSCTLTLSGSLLSAVFNLPAPPPPANPGGNSDRVSWDPTGAAQYVVEFSTDSFNRVIQVTTGAPAVDMAELPAGAYRWRVKADGGGEWAVGEEIVSGNESGVPKAVHSNDDGCEDLFFASANGTWSSFYSARHTGSVGDWAGTGEIRSAKGRGRIQNLFFGSSDPNVLCLTDAENGDAIFVDDVFTTLPEEIETKTARLYKIQEIRAGAGDDIVDMTSQRFEYTGGGQTIRGGDGNDVIWANRGENYLFGDAGDDRIVGASESDVIAGGIGNDSMHGGGGDDVFTFCGSWGVDTVEQLATGTVTLWFASGDESHWDAGSLTYTDGENSVTVSGVAAGKVALKFGDDGSDRYAALASAGSFAEFTSQRIFEESVGGILATS